MPLIRFTCQNCTPRGNYSKIVKRRNFIQKRIMTLLWKRKLMENPVCPNHHRVLKAQWLRKFLYLYHHLTVKLYIENIHILVRPPLLLFDERMQKRFVRCAINKKCLLISFLINRWTVSINNRIDLHFRCYIISYLLP